MKRALVSPAANGLMALASLLLGCTIDNPGMSNPAQPVPWDGPARMTPSAPNTEFDDGGVVIPESLELDPERVYFDSVYTVTTWGDHYDLFNVEATTVPVAQLVREEDNIIKGGRVRPRDGALIYKRWDTQLGRYTIRKLLPSTGEQPMELPECASPLDPNDFESGLPGVDWWLAPDTGDLMWACRIATDVDSIAYTYLNGSSIKLNKNTRMRAIGYNRSYFVWIPAEDRYEIIKHDGSRVRVANGPTAVDAIRAFRDGFWIVQYQHPVLTYELTRWQVAFDGSVKKEVLPLTPSPYGSQEAHQLVLDGKGRVVEMMVSGSAIIRLTPGEPVGEFLYKSEGNRSAFTLLTGP